MAGLVFGFLRYMGGMGMGDVKLAAAVAAWVGFGRFVPVMVLTGLAGGLIAVVWALWAGFMSNALSGVGSLLHSLATRGLKPHPTLVLSNPNTRRMPYAPAIAIGTLLSLLAGF
jgi:prepilin peptidase CpaA